MTSLTLNSTSNMDNGNVSLMDNHRGFSTDGSKNGTVSSGEKPLPESARIFQEQSLEDQQSSNIPTTEKLCHNNGVVGNGNNRLNQPDANSNNIIKISEKWSSLKIFGSQQQSEEAITQRGCNRCQNCPGFSSHEWRNTCTNCRCPRASHDISIGARCCAFHRAGLDALLQQHQPLPPPIQGPHFPVSNPPPAGTTPGSKDAVQPTEAPGPAGGGPPPPALPPPPLLQQPPAPGTEGPPSSSSPLTQQPPLPPPSTTTTCIRNGGAEALGYAWVPQGLPKSRVEEWMALVPEDKAPRLGSPGENYRLRQLTHQLPRQDLSLKFCQHVGQRDRGSFQDFICARNEIALDIGHAIVIPGQPEAAAASDPEGRGVGPSTLSMSGKDPAEAPDDVAGSTPSAPAASGTAAASAGTPCRKCGAALRPGNLAVVTPRFGGQILWHPACFTCHTCEELLVDLTYCIHNEQLYCGRHYAENLKSRCGACDELIFSGQYTKALGKDFHIDHFVCISCNESLTGNRYVLTDDHPCCIPCYEQNFTHSCRCCGQQIGLDSKDMSYKDMHWHEACFSCKKCGASLVGRPFAAKNTLIFCAACYEAEFASRCDACDDTFKPGMKRMEYKAKKWHEKCFRCVACKQQVGGRRFIIPNDSDVYCVDCFEDKFATKCTKCKRNLTSGGVTFKNEAWHRECFACANCQTLLAGQKFASRQDKPYCAACFGELFAKRCTACSKPITGAGVTRFISFEGRHWHSQCFVCALCHVSMAGKGFITDGEDIICPGCAKEKLMGGGGSGGGGGGTSAPSV